MSEKLETIAEQIVGLTILEAKQLSDLLKDKYGIEPAAGGGGMMMPIMAATAAPVEEKVEQTEFDVILAEVGAKKVDVIKVVRAVTGLSLKDAKDLVESAPKPIKEQIPKEEAEALKKQLEDAGAKAEMK